ncbi:hypothetical protein KA531_00870 [Candidatus Saccharibacteria bacterium]|nr:hypothetical protein [Candidatus Saccharibacteria bacterium]
MPHDNQNSTPTDNLALPKRPWTDWIPLLIVIAYIAGLSLITAQLTSINIANLMNYMMGYFFIIFSLFKLIDLPGFAMGYSKYDLISKQWYNWGYIAPFIELSLGVWYILWPNSIILNLVTLLYSLIIVIGVSKKLAKREIFICACLGTVLKVPLTKVSLIEYLIMAIMASYMLISLI